MRYRLSRMGHGERRSQSYHRTILLLLARLTRGWPGAVAGSASGCIAQRIQSQSWNVIDSSQREGFDNRSVKVSTIAATRTWRARYRCGRVCPAVRTAQTSRSSFPIPSSLASHGTDIALGAACIGIGAARKVPTVGNPEQD